MTKKELIVLTVTSSQLPEHHDKQLVPTGECLNPFITVIFFTIISKALFDKKATTWLKTYFPLFITSCVIFRLRIWEMNSNRHVIL